MGKSTMISRRKFGRDLMLAASVAASSFSAAGCLFSGNVFDSILTYIGVGLEAFASIVALVPGLGAATPIVALINAGFATLKAAVTEYEAAPGASKNTALAKIHEALVALQDNLATFVNNVPGAGSAIVNMIAIIVSTLAGFAAKLPLPTSLPASTLARFRRPVLLRGQVVIPMARSLKQFKHDFNRQLEMSGHPELDLR